MRLTLDNKDLAIIPSLMVDCVGDCLLHYNGVWVAYIDAEYGVRIQATSLSSEEMTTLANLGVKLHNCFIKTGEL